jgi:hypothetical protein
MGIDDMIFLMHKLNLSSSTVQYTHPQLYISQDLCVSVPGEKTGYFTGTILKFWGVYDP